LLRNECLITLCFACGNNIQQVIIIPKLSSSHPMSLLGSNQQQIPWYVISTLGLRLALGVTTADGAASDTDEIPKLLLLATSAEILHPLPQEPRSYSQLSPLTSLKEFVPVSGEQAPHILSQPHTHHNHTSWLCPHGLPLARCELPR
jgi:hypothetical protein